MRGFLLLIGLVTALPAMAQSVPDLARALAYRDLDPVRAWLADAEPRPDTVERWRARIALARIDDPARVPGLLEEARATFPEDAGLVLQQAADALLALDAGDGRFERMREARAIGRLLDDALALDPDHPEALTAAVGFHRDVPRIAGGREDRVAPLMERLAGVDPARAAHLRFLAALVDDRIQDAADALDAAIELDPLDRPQWRTQRASVDGRRGCTDAAIEALEALVDAVPAYAPAWYELGRWIAASDRPPARGIAVLERYLLMDRWPEDPSIARALVAMATLKQRAGDEAGARRAMEQAQILDPGIEAGGGTELR